MDRITLWGCGGGVRILQTHHGCKVLLDAFHSAHGQPAYVPSAGAKRPQSVPTLLTVTRSHLEVPAQLPSVPISSCGVPRYTFTPCLGCTFARLKTCVPVQLSFASPGPESPGTWIWVAENLGVVEGPGVAYSESGTLTSWALPFRWICAPAAPL